MSTPVFEIDLLDRTLTLRPTTGEEVKWRMPAGILAHDTNIERLTIRPAVGELMIGLPGGSQALVELASSERSLDELRAGRPAIYLDQNHWSSITAAQFGVGKVSANEARAAEYLVRLIADKKVLLPVSAGHLVETTPLYGERRTALAKTVLQHSRGWQMRNPLHVRVDEVLLAVQHRPPVATSVFAPQADGFFFSSPLPSPEWGDGSAEPLAAVIARIPQILGVYDAVVDTKAIPDERGVANAAASAWAAKFADLAAKLRAEGESAEMARRVANANLIVDMIDDVTRVARLANTTPDVVIDCLTASDDPIAHMPFLAQMRQVLFARLRNTRQTWEANDLIDILFLSCAAGYADVVVGERRTIGYLRQARTPAPKARLATSLAGAAALLDDL